MISFIKEICLIFVITISIPSICISSEKYGLLFSYHKDLTFDINDSISSAFGVEADSSTNYDGFEIGIIFSAYNSGEGDGDYSYLSAIIDNYKTSHTNIYGTSIEKASAEVYGIRYGWTAYIYYFLSGGLFAEVGLENVSIDGTYYYQDYYLYSSGKADPVGHVDGKMNNYYIMLGLRLCIGPQSSKIGVGFEILPSIKYIHSEGLDISDGIKMRSFGSDDYGALVEGGFTCRIVF